MNGNKKYFFKENPSQDLISLNYIYSNKKLDSNEKEIYTHILFGAEDLEDINKNINFTKNTARKKVKSLIDKGYIKKEENEGFKAKDLSVYWSLKKYAINNDLSELEKKLNQEELPEIKEFLENDKIIFVNKKEGVAKSLKKETNEFIDGCIHPQSYFKCYKNDAKKECEIKDSCPLWKVFKYYRAIFFQYKNDDKFALPRKFTKERRIKINERLKEVEYNIKKAKEAIMAISCSKFHTNRKSGTNNFYATIEFIFRNTRKFEEWQIKGEKLDYEPEEFLKKLKRNKEEKEEQKEEYMKNLEVQ